MSRNVLRELRLNRGLSQRQLAQRAHVALRTVHSIEKQHRCRMDTKQKLLRALGLGFDQRHLVWPEES